LDQPLLDVAFDLDLVRPPGLRSWVQSREQAGGDEAPADAAGGALAYAEGYDDLVVGVRAAPGGICQ
jgi:hypothetical protein